MTIRSVVVFIAAWCVTSTSISATSYVVINERAGSGLVKVSADGSSISPIARSVTGTDVAVDSNGNFILSEARSTLLRVTPSGVTSPIANPPAGSNWISLAIDPLGNFIVGDNAQHAIWRVSSTGTSVIRVASYSVTNTGEGEDIRVLIDSAGDYIVAEDNAFAVHLLRITPSGIVSTIALTGPQLPIQVGGMTFDSAGNYMLMDYVRASLFRVTPNGTVTVFAHNATALCCNAVGLARNATTGEFVTALNFGQKIQKISADGTTVTTLASGATNFVFPEGLVAIPDTQRAPVIIIPGILGTSLFNGTDLLWVDPSEACFGLQSDVPDLQSLGLTPAGNSGPNIHTGSLLDGTIGGLFGSQIDFYGGLETALRQAGYQDNRSLFTFPYDWRLDNAGNADLLNTFIQTTVLPRASRV